ncbi:hypothetical protein Q7A53_13550 [Halobacillus rhizosphaerae]|uniref:hypothetical protein n=1 Tax=Halobacillus rhizosphaerae TaxID=3064889 RepID=UPI00398A5446
MEQSSMFDFFGADSDPVYKELNKLVPGEESIQIGEYKVSKNKFGLYEIETAEIHDCVDTIENCYSYLCGSMRAEK